MSFEFKPGSLVELRNRPWIVLPSDDHDLFLIKPLGGTEDEITGIFKLLAFHTDIPKSYDFRKPCIEDLGDFASARLLYNASRLSFRNAAGPFRCLGKLSFRPRSYQMVPLIMALRQEIIRLFIADDVGVGKTIEALLIARELYERREISQFAIICLPHLCDQWQDELKSKFGMEAVIIRSGTASSLERQIRSHENIFRAFPFQIISIDYIKSENKRQIFLDHCPEMVIVDEAHTCARPSGANISQQQRHKLLHDLAAKKDQNLILLTATPHSGKQDEFQSLLGLMNPRYEGINIAQSRDEDRKKLARHFIQRRRADVVQWMDEETHFPERIPSELPYQLGSAYGELFNDVLGYAREIIVGSGADQRKQRYNYWDALALLRGITSSPASGEIMLQNKAEKKKLVHGEDDTPVGEDEEKETVLDKDFSNEDSLPLATLGKSGTPGKSETVRLLEYAKRIKELSGLKNDLKAREAAAQIKVWLERSMNPVIFCRYIQTANYLGELFRNEFKGKAYRNLQIEVITSELGDDLRREKLASFDLTRPRLLIATDCLSEGMNLQDSFNALMHYDLPWNPNRLEQREGRIDRFGQLSPSVEVAMLYGSNNPMDGVVLEILLRKAREIRKSTGISIPFPEDSTTVMNAVMNAVLLKPQVQVRDSYVQGVLWEDEEIERQKRKAAGKFEEAGEREKLSRSIFAQNAIKADEINEDLKDMDEAIGNPKAVEEFVTGALRYMGVQVDHYKDGFRIQTLNIPAKLVELLPSGPEILISFKSPTPAGFKYLGRNHPFVELLTQILINNALQLVGNRPARAAVVRTRGVIQKTVILQFRVRNVIAAQAMHREIVAEEMWLWGYIGSIGDKKFLDVQEAKDLLYLVHPTSNVEMGEQKYWIEEEMTWIRDDRNFRAITDPIARQRANHLVNSHTRVRNFLGGYKFLPVEPVLPMDVFGVYVLLPEV